MRFFVLFLSIFTCLQTLSASPVTIDLLEDSPYKADFDRLKATPNLFFQEAKVQGIVKALHDHGDINDFKGSDVCLGVPEAVLDHLFNARAPEVEDGKPYKSDLLLGYLHTFLWSINMGMRNIKIRDILWTVAREISPDLSAVKIDCKGKQPKKPGDLHRLQGDHPDRVLKLGELAANNLAARTLLRHEALLGLNRGSPADNYFKKTEQVLAIFQRFLVTAEIKRITPQRMLN